MNSEELWTISIQHAIDALGPDPIDEIQQRYSMQDKARIGPWGTPWWRAYGQELQCAVNLNPVCRCSVDAQTQYRFSPLPLYPRLWNVPKRGIARQHHLYSITLHQFCNGMGGGAASFPTKSVYLTPSSKIKTVYLKFIYLQYHTKLLSTRHCILGTSLVQNTLLCANRCQLLRHAMYK